jgi:hypothetical protein
MIRVVKTAKFGNLLLYNFSFLPSKVLTSAVSTFNGGSSVSCPTLSAYFHVESPLLG